jgi:hypothetical protein
VVIRERGRRFRRRALGGRIFDRGRFRWRAWSRSH